MVWSGVTNPATPVAEPAKPHVQIYAVFGDVDLPILKSTCQSIKKNFSLPCRYKLASTPPRWTSRDNRIDAAAFLDAQFTYSAAHTLPNRSTHKRGQIDLWLTSKDVYEGTRPFVFGIMSMTDRIGIVSLYRIRHPKDQSLTMSRLNKVVIHELAHALDLGHHDLDSCVMQVEPDLAHLDSGSSTLCPRCRATASRSMNRMARKGQFLWDRAIGLKVRGELRRAQSLLLALIRNKRTVHPELNDQAKTLWSRLLTK